MKKVVEINKPGDIMGISTKFNVHPVIAKILINREISDVQHFLFGSVPDLKSPFLFPQIQECIDIVKEAITNNKKIRIINDYDVDGICSGYILLDAFNLLGADVDIYTPERLIDGYGLNPQIIRKAKEDNISLVITCDNGIAAFDAINLANELGLKVIVTDHHDIPLDDKGNKRHVNAPIISCKIGYPFKELCGAGVAYKFAEALFKSFLQNNTYVYKYLELVALATVCDVVPLVDENRIFVKEGIKSVSNIGLKALMEVNGISELNVYNIGFIIGPCVNASGRIGSAKEALELLCETDFISALKKAEHLSELNNERKDMTQKAMDEALLLVDNNQKVLVIHLPDCHESIAGIVAGRLKELFYKPAIVFAGQGEIVKGSARSVFEYHMFNRLNEVRDFLVGFGGHPMAAGLSIQKGKIKEFAQIINDKCEITEFEEKIKLEAVIPASYTSRELVSQIDLLSPFGMKNPHPVFGDRIKILSLEVLGKNKTVAKMKILDSLGNQMIAIMFENTNDFLELYKRHKNDTFSIVFKMSLNNYKGVFECQIIIQHIWLTTS